jgi:hypothetical protein
VFRVSPVTVCARVFAPTVTLDHVLPLSPEYSITNPVSSADRSCHVSDTLVAVTFDAFSDAGATGGSGIGRTVIVTVTGADVSVPSEARYVNWSTPS